MWNKLALAATALAPLALVLALTGPAMAAPAPAKSAAPSTAAKPASAQERAAADRLEPLARAAFWASELDKSPADVEAGVKLAVALRQLGRTQEAYSTTQQVLALQPDNVDALLEEARAAIAGNQGFYAIAPAKRVETLRPKDWRALSLLGVAYEQTRQPTLALAAHHQALTLAPDNPAVLCNLAMFLAGNGDSGQAEALLRKAAGEPGATAQIRQDLALVLGLQGKLAEAEQLERQDLPPDVADNNIAYLTAAASAPHGAGVQPTATPTSTSQTEPKDRSWSAVAKAQAQDGTPID